MTLYGSRDKKKMILSGVLLIVLVAVVSVFMMGVQIGNNDSEEIISATLIVGEEYAQEVISSDSIQAGYGVSPMDLVQEVYGTTASYGDGFIETIEGIGDDGRFWFYYVNGILSPIGAKEYTIEEGDVIRWDCHGWSMSRIPTVLVGEFPYMFTNGFGTEAHEMTIIYEASCSAPAERLSGFLEGVGVSATLIEEHEVDTSSLGEREVIVIGTIDMDMIEDIGDVEALGWLVDVNEASFEIYDDTGASAGILEEGGVITASGSPWDPEGSWSGGPTLMLVCATQVSWVDSAVDALLMEDSSVFGCAMIVVDGEGVHRIPSGYMC